jgi:hypothetical protein
VIICPSKCGARRPVENRESIIQNLLQVSRDAIPNPPPRGTGVTPTTPANVRQRDANTSWV